MDCIERAQLIQRVWDANMDLLSKVLMFQNELKSEIEKQSLEEARRLHHLYQRDLEYKIEKINNLTSEIEEKNKNFDKLGKEVRYLRKKINKFETVNKNLMNEIKNLQDDNTDLVNDNMKMSMAFLDVDVTSALNLNQKYVETIKTTLNRILEDQMELEGGGLDQRDVLKKRRISEIMKKIEEKNSTIGTVVEKSIYINITHFRKPHSCK